MTNDNDTDDTDAGGTGVKLLLTGIIVVLMVPGLIIEPGPITEIAGVGAILAGAT
jgi:hypothetical protein